MAWEATLDVIRRRGEKKQLEKDRVMGLFDRLSGMGMDVFKTLNANKLAKEMPGITAGAGLDADLERMKAAHGYELESMEAKADIDRSMLDDEQASALDLLQREYLLRSDEIKQTQGWEANQATLDREFEERLANLQMSWETGEREATQGWQSGENELDRAASMEEAKLRGQQDENAIRLSSKLKGTDPGNITLWKDLLESAYQQGQLNGTVIVDELGQERIDPARVADFRAILEAGLSGGDASLNADLQRRIDAFINSLATPGVQDDSGVTETVTGPNVTPSEGPMLTQLQAILAKVKSEPPADKRVGFGSGGFVPYAGAGITESPEERELMNAIRDLEKPGQAGADALAKVQALLKRYLPEQVSPTKANSILGLPY